MHNIYICVCVCVNVYLCTCVFSKNKYSLLHVVWNCLVIHCYDYFDEYISNLFAEIFEYVK